MLDVYPFAAQAPLVRTGSVYRVYNYDGEMRNPQADPDVKTPDGRPGSGT